VTVADGGGSLTIDAAALPLPAGAATAANQATIIGHVDGIEGILTTIDADTGNIATGLGAPADAAASSDTGTFSLLSLVKRGLQNWTTLLGRVPSLTVSSTRLLVDGSGVTQPVSAASLPLPSGAATSSAQSTGNSSLGSIDGKTPALQSGAVPVGDNGGSLTVDGRSGSPLVVFTRPANTTAYGAADVIGSASTANHEATSAGANGSLIQILSASLLVNATSPPSGFTTVRIHIWDSAPAAIADNDPFAAAAADRSKYCGFIDMAAIQAIGGGFCWTHGDYIGRPIRLTGTSFFFNIALTGAAGHTPASATEFRARFHTVEIGA
jgi:hypothetical protein